MTVTVESPVDADRHADEVEQVETTPERSDLQLLTALLAQAYIAMPLFV